MKKKVKIFENSYILPNMKYTISKIKSREREFNKSVSANEKRLKNIDRIYRENKSKTPYEIAYKKKGLTAQENKRNLIGSIFLFTGTLLVPFVILVLFYINENTYPMSLLIGVPIAILFFLFSCILFIFYSIHYKLINYRKKIGFLESRMYSIQKSFIIQGG